MVPIRSSSLCDGKCPLEERLSGIKAFASAWELASLLVTGERTNNDFLRQQTQWEALALWMPEQRSATHVQVLQTVGMEPGMAPRPGPRDKGHLGRRIAVAVMLDILGVMALGAGMA